MSKLSEAIEFAEAVGPLPRCPHGKALRDGAGEALEPPCGCRTTQTPNTETQAQSETLEQIASEIANGHIDSHESPSGYAALRDAILSALRNERERAIRIINDHQALDKCEDNCWTAIKSAVREGR